MMTIIAGGLVLAFLAPFLLRAFGPKTFAGLAIYPAVAFGFFALAKEGVISIPWVPQLDANLAFRLDGLSRAFGLLISGLGTLILLYASSYFTPKPNLARFAGAFVGFMAAMLGLVLSNSLISVFLFWELTSITSFLLIGFYHKDAESRTSANQAFLITGAGGLAMLVGMILLGNELGTYTISEMGPLSPTSGLAAPALILIFLGCATKSSQFPFHFWLPNAMAAPTPVSAFLHSATMVKAGVFLLARLEPVLEGLPLWQPLLGTFGGLTVVASLVLMFWHRDLKKLLAYSTLGALGMLVYLLSLTGDYATKAFVGLLFAHALYKGSLFLLAGIIDHETGTRDIGELSGLRRSMPWTATAAALTMGSAFGLAGFLGFFGKEYAILATKTPWGWVVLIAFALGAGLAATRVAVMPFFVGPNSHPEAHDPPWSMRVGPLVLGFCGLAGGLGIAVLGPAILSSMAASVEGQALALKWSAIPVLNAAFAIGLGLIASGLLVGWRLRTQTRQLPSLDRGWRKLVDAIPRLAAIPTNWIQQGKLRYSFGLYFVLITACVAGPMFAFGGFGFPSTLDTPQFHEIALVALAVAAAIAAVFSKSRLAAISMLGISGTGISILFLNFGAPDLALTQLITDLLAIVIAVLVFHRLPRFSRLSTNVDRIRDGAIAVAFGAVMFAVVVAIQTVPPQTQVAAFYAENSVEKAYGRNIVNTILVDFRAMDTMGEVTVLALAALGVYALVKLRHVREEDV